MNVIQEEHEIAATNAMGYNPGGQPMVTLTIRLIMQGKEVGSIIGKKGENIKRFREESGAKITISDGSCPERIVTITGSTEAILKAFTLIARKFEEFFANNILQDSINCSNGNSSSPSSPTIVTMKLIVPASQCGSLIGKGGSKIKEIRESTGVSIQVASEMLPNSTERAVTVSGTADAITKCIYQIACVLLESPPKGPTIPYRPKPSMPPVFFTGGQAYTIQGQFAIPHPDLTKLHRLALQHAPLMSGQVGSLSPQASMAQSAATSPGVATAQLTAEMNIPNDVIGSVIGKGGSKINEIRQLSGANIKINNSEDGSKDRVVVITGTAEAINLAQYLITTSNGLLTHHMSDMSTTTTTTTNNNNNNSGGGAAGGAGSGTMNSLSAMAAVANSVTSSGSGKMYGGSSSNKSHLLNLTNSNGKSNKNDRKYAPY